VPPFRKLLRSIQADGTSINDQEFEIEMPLTGRRVMSLSGRMIQEEDETKRKILLAFVDTTRARHASDALTAAKLEADRANIAKSRFLAAASHDLRQPLQTMTLLQGLLEKHVHDEAAIKLVLRLDEAVSTMASMLDKLLDINQLEAGIVRAEIVDFPVQRLLDVMDKEFAVHAVTNGLAWDVMPNSLNVRSDPGLLEQIIRNLLVNAVKYTPPTGKLLLGCRKRGDKLRIEVWDSGTGIAEQDLKAIFEEFHQLDNPARERSKGLGLGLAIVKRVADLLGHTVDVRSRLGSGSVFTVEVPLGGTDSFAPVTLPLVKTRSKARMRGTILIVEDDPAVRDMLQLLFEGEGHVTRVAADGHKALELLGQHSTAPDLIIADYNLPLGMSGLDVIRRLQAHYTQTSDAAGATKNSPAFSRTIPAIILTGDISTASLREIAGHGCVHLNKPVKAMDLTGLVQELLGQTARPEPVRGPEAARVMQSAPQLRSDSTIFVVDDDRVIRETMRDLLAANGYAVEIFADGPEFLAALRPGCAGCLLVDAVMPEMSGLELMDRLKREGHHLPAIMITGHGEVSMAVQAMKAGAADFIEKPVGPQELLASIERILDQARNADTRTVLHETAALRIACLTTRQQQILDMVLAGHPSKNIAADLGISQRTVDNHRAAIMKKTGSKSLPELIRTALSAA
jgi:two-component system, chemotaxis family, CheB/CheR fusion protein